MNSTGMNVVVAPATCETPRMVEATIVSFEDGLPTWAVVLVCVAWSTIMRRAQYHGQLL